MPDLVIFDCDGVLVDSEIIFARVLGECLTAAEFPATAADALLLGFGKNRDTLSAAVAARFGRPLPDGFFDTMRTQTALVLERELVADAGNRGAADGTAGGALRRLERPPRAGARAARADRPLGVLRSACLSARCRSPRASRRRICFCWPPAGSARARPACIVVEDSVIGVAAAVAAGMPVVGFAAAAIAPATTPTS